MHDVKRPSDAAIETIAGFNAGVVATLVAHPLDVVKTRLQVRRTTNSPQFGESLRLFRSIYHQEGGLRATYRGLGVNLIGNSASWALYFFSYDQTKKLASWLTGRTSLTYSDYFWASGSAGIFTAICTNPLWVLKTRMLSTSASTTGAYRSTMEGLKQIYQVDGFQGYYRGLIPSFFGVAHGAVQFTFYEQLKARRRKQINSQDLTSWDVIILSAVSKIAAGAATYPYQVLRARLQTYEAADTYSGVRDVIYQIARYEGVWGFYRGLMPNLFRVLPSTCVMFLVYENSKLLLRPRPENKSGIESV